MTRVYKEHLVVVEETAELSPSHLGYPKTAREREETTAGPWYNPSLFFVVMEGRLRILGSYTQEFQPVLSVAESSDEARKRLNGISDTIGQFEHFAYSISSLVSNYAPVAQWIERRTSNP